MPLLLVQSFVNTYEADTGVDLLADLDMGLPWLKEAGLLDSASVTTASWNGHARCEKASGPCSSRTLAVKCRAPRSSSRGRLGAASRLQPIVGEMAL